MSEALSRTEDPAVPASDAVAAEGRTDTAGAEKDKQASAIPKGAWAVMFTVLGASMMDLLDATVMNVAAPKIRSGLGASNTEYQWISTGYVLSFAVLLIAGGRLGDIVGRRQMFIFGLTGFTIMSAVCAIAQNPGELIAARL